MKRRTFINLASLLGASASAGAQSLDFKNLPKMPMPGKWNELQQQGAPAVHPDWQSLTGAPVTNVPVIFVGHGSPMNAIVQSDYTNALRNVGMQVSKPSAILVISAHWLTESKTAITGNEKPRTIHDFQGFPNELAQIQYPAMGSPEMAEITAELLGDVASIRSDWGLDHGTWTVLRYLFPHANVPVLQLSIDIYKGPEYHYTVGKLLGELRARNVLILGSGNIVHPERSDRAAPFLAQGASQQWAANFDAVIWRAIQQRDMQTLFNYPLIENAQYAVPYADHYLPLLYVMGAASATRGLPAVIYHGWQYGTISMRSFSFK